MPIFDVVKHNEWISFKENPPQDGEFVIVFNKYTAAINHGYFWKNDEGIKYFVHLDIEPPLKVNYGEDLTLWVSRKEGDIQNLLNFDEINELDKFVIYKDFDKFIQKVKNSKK